MGNLNKRRQEILAQLNLKQCSKAYKNLIQILKHPESSSKTKLEALYILCYFDFELFVTTFFKPHCQYPFSSMHRDFFKMESDPTQRGKRLAIAAPRGHAKTTFLVHFKAVHAIVYGYEQFILILGHSAPEAESKVRAILEELENNPLLKAVYGPLAPKKGQLGWSTKNFVTQNKIRVMAKSRGKQVRGLKHETHRPSLIILDDIEAADKVWTDEQRYKTKQWFEKDVLKLGSVDGKANIIVIGTCLQQEALLPDLLKAPGWHGVKYQAVLSFAHNQSLWKKWEAIYLDLSNPDREADANRFYQRHENEMLEGTSVLWPEAEPYDLLMKLILVEGQASFQSEKQNDPYDPTRQVFNMDEAKRFKVEYTPEGEIHKLVWSDGSGRFIWASDIYKIVAFHDPALCEGKDADYAAIVVCAIDTKGYMYCLEAYIEKVPPSRQIQQAFFMYEKWKWDVLYLEENNFQGILKENYHAMQEANARMPVIGVKQTQNKVKRIASLEPLVTNGQLLFNADLNPRLISQLRLFPTTHDDGPDALRGALDKFIPKARYLGR